MSLRAQTLLEIAARETSNPHEALSAIRKLASHIEKHGWPSAPSPPQTISGREVARLRAENQRLQDHVEALQDEFARLKEAQPPALEDLVREAVATSRSKAEAVTKLGWCLNSYSYKRLDAYGFDQSHFVGQAWRRGRKTRLDAQ